MSEPRADNVSRGPIDEEVTTTTPGTTNTTGLDNVFPGHELDHYSGPRPGSVSPPAPDTYKKRRGFATLAGQHFEIKMAALFLLRGLERTRGFSLMTNAEVAGQLDDIVYGERDAGPGFMVQLKHKETAGKLQDNVLLSTAGDFSLLRYLVSIGRIKKSFAADESEDLKHFGTFDSLKFVVFTNACMEPSLYSNDNGDVIRLENDGFKTGGKTFSINKTGSIGTRLKEISKFQTFLVALKTKAVAEGGDVVEFDKAAPESGETYWQHAEVRAKLKDLKKNPRTKQLDETLRWKAFGLVIDDATCDEFLDKLWICMDQPNESKLDVIVKEQIKSVWLSDDIEVEAVFGALVKGLAAWWEDKRGYVLHSDTRIWTNALLESKRERLKSLGVEFVVGATETLARRIKTFKSKLGILNRSLTGLTLFRLLQCELDKTVVVDLNQLGGETAKVVAAWKGSWCDTLAVDCGAGVVTAPEAMRLEKLLRDVVATGQNKRIVLVAKKDDAFAKEMRKWTQCDEHEDDFEWEHLTERCRATLRSRKLSFQGATMTLEKLIRGREELTSALDGVTVELLARGELRLGRTVEEPIAGNVSRSLRATGGVSTPVRVCSDVADKMVLVTGHPGMGKSTLLRELGKATKTRDPTLWVSRIDLTECCKYLQGVALEDITDGIEFLQRFSYSLGSTRFEEALFRHCLNEDKMVILLDGFDEISPSYDEKMLKILKRLPKEKVHKLWVTSRSVTKERIEKTLGVGERELMPFTRDDQTRFLVERWKGVGVGKRKLMPTVRVLGTRISVGRWKVDGLVDDERELIPFVPEDQKWPDRTKEFADSLLSLADETFTDDNFLTGVPLLVAMMAEVYREDLVRYDGTPESLPVTLDLLTLYDAFVRRKHELYFSDKKKVDPSIPANENEMNGNFEKFMKNHMQASLVYLLHPDDYKDLNQPEEDLREFIKEIQRGHEKTGIVDGIDSQNQIRFIHRTFCEYFGAKWLAENYKNAGKFLRKITFDPRYKEVNGILDRILTKESPVHVCVLDRQLNKLERLLDARPESLDARDAGGRTALLLLASVWDDRHGSTYDAIGRLLLDRGASVHVTDPVFGHRPLRFADRNRAWSLAGMMLNSGGESSDMSTTTNRMKDVVFVAFVAFVRAPGVGDVAALATLAARHGDKHLVRYLIEQHDCLDVRRRRGEDDDVTLMHHAAHGGRVGLMAHLADVGVAYTSRDARGETPLHHAARAGRTFAVEHLVDRGADVDARNDARATPLMVAAASSDADEEVVKCLIASGADVNACADDADGGATSALSLAAASGKLATVECLVRQGVDLDIHGRAALRRAREYRQVGVVRYLQQVNNIAADAPFGKLSLVKGVLFGIALSAIVVSVDNPSFHVMAHLINTFHLNITQNVVEIICWLIFQPLFGLKVIKNTKVKCDRANIMVWFGFVIWSCESLLISLIIGKDFLMIDLVWLVLLDITETWTDGFKGTLGWIAFAFHWPSGVYILGNNLKYVRGKPLMFLLYLASGVAITLGIELRHSTPHVQLYHRVSYIGGTMCCSVLIAGTFSP